jgi:hypothetical protein
MTISIQPDPATAAQSDKCGRARFAQVWTMQTGNRERLSPSSRRATLHLAAGRPLPHYGAQSYLVFDGTRAIGAVMIPGQLIPVSRAHR